MPAQRALLVTSTGSAMLMLPPWVVQVQAVSSAWCEIPVLWWMLLTSHCQPPAPRVLGMLRWGFPDLLTLELVNEAIRKTIFWNNKGSWPVLLPSPKGKTNQQPCILNSYGSLIPIPVVLVQYGNYLRRRLADTLLWFKQDNTEQGWIFHTSQLVNPWQAGTFSPCACGHSFWEHSELPCSHRCRNQGLLPRSKRMHEAHFTGGSPKSDLIHERVNLSQV